MAPVPVEGPRRGLVRASPAPELRRPQRGPRLPRSDRVQDCSRPAAPATSPWSPPARHRPAAAGPAARLARNGRRPPRALTRARRRRHISERRRRREPANSGVPPSPGPADGPGFARLESPESPAANDRRESAANDQESAANHRREIAANRRREIAASDHRENAFRNPASPAPFAPSTSVSLSCLLASRYLAHGRRDQAPIGGPTRSCSARPPFGRGLASSTAIFVRVRGPCSNRVWQE